MMKRGLWLLLALTFVFLSGTSAFGVNVGIYTSHEFTNGELTIHTDGADLRLAFVRENILRVDFLPMDEASLVDNSLAVLPDHSVPVLSNLTETDTSLVLTYGSLSVQATKGLVRLSYHEGGRLLTTEPESGGFDGDYSPLATWEVQNGESFYGTGEHNPALDLRGQVLDNWNSQNGNYNGRQTTMNISVPVLLSSGRWGVFIDNPRWGQWNICASDYNLLKYQVSYGPLRFYLFSGADMPSLLEAYTWLTGRQPLPPRWALGYLQSKFGYQNRTEATNTVSNLRSNRIPADGIVLDLYWFSNMGDLNWNQSQWPEPRTMVSDFLDQGIHTILINEPYFVENSFNYSTLQNNPTMVGRYDDQNPFYISNWWSCDCNALLLDLTNPVSRDWYKAKAGFQLDDGIGGLWTDLGEPENHPDGMMHTGGGVNDVHNSFNLLWAQTVAEAFAEKRPGQRVMNLTRSGSAGIQRYGVFTWSGDVRSIWEDLYVQPSFILQMGMSGLSYHSSDLGGFADGADADLYTRWLAQGALSPVMRAHGVNKPTEPYGFDAIHTDWNRRIVELRYQLLPYIYTMAYENSQTGMPMVRPLFFADPEDSRFRNEDTAYLFGDRLLVAPVMVEGATNRQVPFPSGDWIDYWSDELYHGSSDAVVTSTLGTIPLFVRAGSLLPFAPVMQYTDERALDTLMIHSYPADNGSDEYTLYEDDGISDSYTSGACTMLPMSADYSEESQVVRIGPRSGAGFDGMVTDRTFLIEVHRAVQPPDSVMLNGSMLPLLTSLGELRSSSEGYAYDAGNDRLYVQYSSTMQNQYDEIRIDGAITDLEAHPQAPSQFLVSKAYPNPFNSSTRVTITLPQTGKIKAELYDITGRLVATLVDGTFESGTHNISIDGKRLASGTYFLRVANGQDIRARKLVLVK